MSSIGFETAFRQELKALRPDLELPEAPTPKQLQDIVDCPEGSLAALCLSGGGIRSASFSLGVIQALARFGVLGEFDYLSTVSGGGYIGSWLTAWRHHDRSGREAAPDRNIVSDKAVYAALDRTAHPDGKEASEIGGLRADSNYLTPKLGLLSADTWTVIALFIRNLVLNWLVFFPFFMSVLLLPWLCYDFLHAASDWWPYRWPLMWLGLPPTTAGLAFASYGRRRASDGWLTDGWFVVTVLIPVIVGAMAFTFGLAALEVLSEFPPWFERPTDLSEVPAWYAGIVPGALCYAAAWLLASAFLRRYPAPTASRATLMSSESPLLDLGAWMLAGGIAGGLLMAGMHLHGRLAGMPDNNWLTNKTAWLTVLGSSWTMLSIFAGELAYVGLRSYARRGDMDREWLGRAAGWLTAGAVSWALLAAIVLFGPFLVEKGLVAATGWIAVSGISGVVAVVLAGGTKTAATEALEATKWLPPNRIASIAGVVFAVSLAIGLSALNNEMAAAVAAYFPLKPTWVLAAWGVAFLLCLSAAVSWCVNVNRFSLHALYRNRLVRAYLGSARANAVGRHKRDPDPFTGFDQTDNVRMSEMPRNKLLHVVNIALNVVSSSNEAWQERKAESFTMTPLASGNPNVGYRPTKTYGAKAASGGITLGTAMAISGAAVSPNMGYHSSPMLGFLLMLFNVRLGWWLGNPRRGSFDREGPNFGIVPLLQELAGQTTDRGRWIYLSDGGHFENLGLYEMVRRRCRVIVISDAGCDPDCAFEDLGNAVRKIYIDQGVSINFETLGVTPRQTLPALGYYCALGTIKYPGSADLGWLLYIKPGYHGNEPADIRSYAIAHKTFPHETTANQWFSESQLESYRGLGAHIAELICGGGQPVPATSQPAAITLATLKRRAEAYLADVAERISDAKCCPVGPKPKDAAGSGDAALIKGAAGTT